MSASPSPSEVVGFWRDAGPDKWFAKDPAFDAEIKARFEGLHMAAAAGALEGWLETAEGALALMVLLDQFPRNMYRGTGHAFATDGLARAYARRAIDSGLDSQLSAQDRYFLYLPFEHSEHLGDQELAVELTAHDAEQQRWAVVHREIIERFGRFPHRNACLGRKTTPDEQAFLDEGGFAG